NFSGIIKEHYKTTLHAFNAKSQRDHLLADVIHGEFGAKRLARVIENREKVVFVFQSLEPGHQVGKPAGRFFDVDVLNVGRRSWALDGATANDLVDGGREFRLANEDSFFVHMFEAQLVKTQNGDIAALHFGFLRNFFAA